MRSHTGRFISPLPLYCRTGGFCAYDEDILWLAKKLYFAEILSQFGAGQHYRLVRGWLGAGVNVTGLFDRLLRVTSRVDVYSMIRFLDESKDGSHLAESIDGEDLVIVMRASKVLGRFDDGNLLRNLQRIKHKGGIANAGFDYETDMREGRRL